MKIKTITSQLRRDFEAILICEHCDHEEKLNDGYDDAFYHKEVIPSFKCDSCGKKAGDEYRPLTTKYRPDEVI